MIKGSFVPNCNIERSNTSFNVLVLPSLEAIKFHPSLQYRGTLENNRVRANKNIFFSCSSIQEETVFFPLIEHLYVTLHVEDTLQNEWGRSVLKRNRTFDKEPIHFFSRDPPSSYHCRKRTRGITSLPSFHFFRAPKVDLTPIYPFLWPLNRSELWANCFHLDPNHPEIHARGGPLLYEEEDLCYW